MLINLYLTNDRFFTILSPLRGYFDMFFSSHSIAAARLFKNSIILTNMLISICHGLKPVEEISDKHWL